LGSAHNTSLDVGRGARNKASTRTPVHFYLDVPYYEYDLECGTGTRIHTFQSRTPVIAAEEHDNFCTLWCDRCMEYRVLDSREPEPLNKIVSADDLIGYEQDKGILRERIALAVQDAGFLTNDREIADFAVRFRVPVSEIKRINAGLRAPDGLSGEPDLCQAGKHEMTMDNIAITRGRRQCKACRAEAQRQRRAAKKQ
jgi:hypothetical protein